MASRRQGPGNPPTGCCPCSVLVKPYGSTVFTPINETGDGATAWAAEANRYWTPWLFPGTFRACARNNGTLAANVNLSLRTDY